MSSIGVRIVVTLRLEVHDVGSLLFMKLTQHMRKPVFGAFEAGSLEKILSHTTPSMHGSIVILQGRCRVYWVTAYTPLTGPRGDRRSVSY